MPRPRPRPRERRAEFKPFEAFDGRTGQHLHGHDFFGDAYGDPRDFFDRDRMAEDWRVHRDEIIRLAREEYPFHTGPLWSEEEFDNATS